MVVHFRRRLREEVKSACDEFDDNMGAVILIFLICFSTSSH